MYTYILYVHFGIFICTSYYGCPLEMYIVNIIFLISFISNILVYNIYVHYTCFLIMYSINYISTLHLHTTIPDIIFTLQFQYTFSEFIYTLHLAPFYMYVLLCTYKTTLKSFLTRISAAPGLTTAPQVSTSDRLCITFERSGFGSRRPRHYESLLQSGGSSPCFSLTITC